MEVVILLMICQVECVFQIKQKMYNKNNKNKLIKICVNASVKIQQNIMYAKYIAMMIYGKIKIEQLIEYRTEQRMK